jgi:hypothetical protein
MNMKNVSVKFGWLAISLTAFVLSAFVLAGCKNNDPEDQTGDVEDPKWTVTVDNNMTMSMTVVAKVSFTQNQGVLAAFIDDVCCGVAGKEEFKDGLYFLYISPATEAGGDVKLRFYSPDLKRIFAADKTFPFANDTQLGTVAEPFAPTFVLEK